MELRTVNTFLHIAELHSFSRTARQLGYSQSAVSSQIAQLEAELGTPRFDRVGKTVRLTDAGQTFLGYARTLLETAQQAQAALQPAQQVRGSLRIALADSVCSTFLPGLLQRYHARCPQVELVLHTASSDEMLQLLSTNQVDLIYNIFYFIALQVSDQVPSDIRRHLWYLVHQFLYFILSEVPGTRMIDIHKHIHRLCLAYRQ